MSENAKPDFEKLQKALNQFAKMHPNCQENHTKSRILKTGWNWNENWKYEILWEKSEKMAKFRRSTFYGLFSENSKSEK